MQKEKVRIVVADDHAIMRNGVRQIVMGENDLEVVGEAVDGRDLLHKARQLKPTVVVLDVSMPGLSGLEVLPLLREALPRVRTLVFSMHDKEVYIHRALAAGALGYVLKSDPVREVLAAVRKVAAGQYFLSPSLEAEIIRLYLNPKAKEKSATAGYDSLSRREQQVFRLVVDGNTSKEIAAALSVSPRTVEKHRANIIHKLGVRDITALIRYAVKIGVVDPDIWTD